MKYVFYGTPEFAALILRKLIAEGMPPLAIVTNPDRPKGRKKTLAPPPVKQCTEGSGYPIEVLQPERVHDVRERLTALKPDVALVAAYAKILPNSILGIPRHGTIGIHPSFLPKYRGASPIQSVILAGKRETGITLYLLDEKVDHGSIVAESAMPVDSADTYESLLKKLAGCGASLLMRALPKFLRGEIIPKPQDDRQATYTKKFTSEDAYVTPEELARARDGMHRETAEIILRKIRALNPEPGVWTRRNGKRIKLLGAELTGNALTLKNVQVEGKKPIPAQRLTF